MRIKPTTFKADEIIVGRSPGGASLVSDADVLNAQFATVIVQQSGVGHLDATSLRRRLAGKVARVSANITDLSEGIDGTTTPKDLDTFFELLWLNATAPRYDSNAVAAFVSQMKNQLAGRDRIPMMALLDTLAAVMTQNSPRQPPVTATTLAMLNPARAMALYKERFADFGDYTLVVVGNVQLDSLRPRVEQWLAALPATGRKESFKDVAPRPPAGVITKTIRKGKEPVAQQFAVYSGQTEPPDAMTELAAEAVGEILQTRLLETLREAMGATYSVNAMTEVSRRPHGEYSAMIQFTSKPEQVDSLWAAAQGIIAALRTDGPTADELPRRGAVPSRHRGRRQDQWLVARRTAAGRRGRAPARRDPHLGQAPRRPHPRDGAHRGAEVPRPEEPREVPAGAGAGDDAVGRSEAEREAWPSGEIVRRATPLASRFSLLDYSIIPLTSAASILSALVSTSRHSIHRSSANTVSTTPGRGRRPSRSARRARRRRSHRGTCRPG